MVGLRQLCRSIVFLFPYSSVLILLITVNLWIKNTKYMFMYYCQKSYITPNVKLVIHDLICYIKIEKKHKVMGV